MKKRMAIRERNNQRGAVSLIVVIFTALLVTIITIGFVSLMVRNQQQATQSDLSQSAYDSALAGVEDAKRVLLLDKKCKENDNFVNGVPCGAITTAINSGDCSTIKTIFGGGTGETLVGQSENDKQLRQSYTCAKILLNTPDYRGKDLSNGQSQLIPLIGTTAYDKVEIMWFTQEDAAAASGETEGLGTVSLSLPLTTANPLLPLQDTWSSQTPPVLRAQLMQAATTFSLSDFDDAGVLGNSSNSSALFLYPSTVAGATSFSQDSSLSPKEPQNVKCDASSFRDGGFACKVELLLPSPKGGDANNRLAYLRLNSFYNTTRYRVVLKDSAGQIVPFYGVQPEVDVTGKANNIFRRVKARVQLDAAYPYPESTLDLNGNLCKDYVVTENSADYSGLNLDRCDPRG